MLTLIIGGSASGKSKYAENLTLDIKTNKLYIATMMPFTDETKLKIKKHIKMREDKNFTSIDCYTNLEKFSCGYKSENKKFDMILLECMSNLVANEMYSGEIQTSDMIVKKILAGTKSLLEISKNVIIVSNNVFCDEQDYLNETKEYIKIIGEINNKIADISETVTEVVCNIPIYIKGGK